MSANRSSAASCVADPEPSAGISEALSARIPEAPASTATTQPARVTAGGRVATLDIAKGLGILLVVLGHTGWIDELHPLNDALGSFRMPLFFFVSGVTFPAHRGVGTIARQRADALLKPFAVVVLLTGLVRGLQGSPSVEPTLLALSYATGFTIPCGPLWFLPHLWLLSVLSALLLELVQGLRAAAWRGALLGALIVAGYPLLGAFHGRLSEAACAQVGRFDPVLLRCGLPFSADLVLVTGFFFLSGHFLAERVRSFEPDARLLGAALLGSVGLWAAFHFTIDLDERRYDGLVVSTVQALSAIYVALCLCTGIRRSARATRLLAYVGRGSLFILLCHPFVLDHAFRLLRAVAGGGWVARLGSFAATIAVSLTLWEITKRSRLLSRLMLPGAAAARPAPRAAHG